MSVLSALSEITATWLKCILAASLAKTCKPNVKNLQVKPAVKWNEAETAFLRVAYEQDDPSLPTRFFVKLRSEEVPLSDVFPGEQRFYQDASNADVPIAPCFAAIADNKTGSTCVLLEDLS